MHSYSYIFVENFHVNNLVLKIFHAINLRETRVHTKIINFNLEHFLIYGTSVNKDTRCMLQKYNYDHVKLP